MREDLKTRSPVNSYISIENNARLLDLCELTGYKKSQILDIALSNLFDVIDKTGEIPSIKIKAASN